MSTSTSPSPHSAIVDRLRAAGCVFAEDEARLLISEAATATELATMVQERVAGLPLEHILGFAEFCGLRVMVEPGVFVPRRRTEFLATRAVELARPHTTVVDMCCGSGAIGATLLASCDGIELHACDLDPIAVRCARRNLAASGARVYRGDLYRALPTSLRGRVDVLVANAPYVPSGAIELMPQEARLHEPMTALDGGVDGFAVLGRAVTEATRWLAPGGHLLFETSRRQADQALRLVAEHGMRPSLAASDEFGATVVIGVADSPQRRG